MILTPSITLPSFYNPYTDRGIGPDAEKLEEQLTKVRGKTSITLEIPYLKSSDALDEIFEQCCKDNWDGYGAKRVHPGSYKLAKKFLAVLPSRTPTPDIAADPDGEISLDWYISPFRTFSVSIGVNGELSYAGLFGSNKAYGAEFFQDEIPQTILSNLERLFSSIQEDSPC